MSEQYVTGDTAETDDSALSAEKEGDVEYLGSLGYKQELQRSLSTIGSFAIQFSLIGVSLSIFLLFGYGLTNGGPLMILPFVIGGGLQMLVGLSVAQLVSAYPLAGGAYQIIRRITSPALAWQAGWWLAIALLAAVASEAIGLIPYVGPWFGISSPTYIQSMVGAAIIIAIITVINMIGIRVASVINGIGVLAEMLGLSTIVVLLLIKGAVHPVSFITTTAGVGGGANYIRPFLLVMLMPAFMISSFDSTGHTGEETKNAAIAAPRGVVIANFASYAYAIIALVVLLLSIPNVGDAMKSSAPVSYIVSTRLGSNFSTALTAVVAIAFLVNMEILQLTTARLFWAQARDAQFPLASWFHKLGRNKAPINATLVCAVIAFALCLYSNLINVLAGIVALAFAVSYTVVVAAGMLAKRRGTLPKHPWNYGPFTSVIDWIAILWSIALCAILVYQDWLHVGVGFLVAGVIVGLLLYYVALPLTRGRGGTQTENVASAGGSAAPVP
jgi:amino acid transporter